MIRSVLPEGAVYERNPYFYKIDTAGNQLPYIDTVRASHFTDHEAMILATVTGNYDYLDWGTKFEDVPVLVENEDKGNYKTFMTKDLWGNHSAYFFNQNYEDDPALGELLRNKTFRQALSIAINREQVNSIIAAGQGILLGIIVLFGAFKWFGVDVGGLFSDRYVGEPWSFGKFLDFLTHIPVPMILIGAAGTATLIRVMRGTLLDELRQQYVITARAKGVRETPLLFKYPVRLAINPIISTIGYLLPAIFSGQVITAVVLRLSTMGPMLLRALISQDMFLAGSVVLILSFLVVVGTLISDLLLVVVDPRIRYESSAELR